MELNESASSFNVFCKFQTKLWSTLIARCTARIAHSKIEVEGSIRDDRSVPFACMVVR
jgi:hypothetical protein